MAAKSRMSTGRRVLSLALALAGLALGATGITELAAHRAAAATPGVRQGAATAKSHPGRLHPPPPAHATSRIASSAKWFPTPVPSEVVIPALSAAAPVVEHVGVQTSGPERGLLSAPADFHDLGWYRFEHQGVLVIDGHVGFAAGAGPLAYIGSLRIGDPVLVTYPHGSRAYRITQIRSVVKGGLPARYFRPRYDGKLMLITCDYQSAFHDGHFANNVYVIASPVTAS
jgi:hypothetical protein